jgi:hypothetical protein
MKLKFSEFKKLIQECISEIFEEENIIDSPVGPVGDASVSVDDDPKVKNQIKKTEFNKRETERVRQRALDAKVKVAEKERSVSQNPEGKKAAIEKIKQLKLKKSASKSAEIAATKKASAVK